MRIVNGSRVRVNVNLRLRSKPATTSATICTVQAGVQVTAMGVPANGWMKATVRGWKHPDKPGYVYSEPDTKESVQARRGVLGWRQVEHTGYMSMANKAWHTVEDGPA